MIYHQLPQVKLTKVCARTMNDTTDTSSPGSSHGLIATQARFSGQELDAAYKQLAAHGIVTASSRAGGIPQLSDSFMSSLQVLTLPIAEHPVVFPNLHGS